MQSSLQIRGRSASPLDSSRSNKSNPEHPPSPAYSASGRNKKRDRTDSKATKSVDSSSKRKRNLDPPEISSLVDKDGGLISTSAVERLYSLMQQDLNKSSRKFKEVALRRTSLALVIGSTVRDDCLKKIVQFGGLPLLNAWLQDAHKGKHADGASSDEGEKTIDDLILALLQALEKLPVDLDALTSCHAGRTVKTLRNHSNSKIHMKAKKLVEAWMKKVDAEMKQSEEAKVGSKQDACRAYKPGMSKDSSNVMKNGGGGSLDGNMRSSGGFGNVVKNNSSSMADGVAHSLKKGGSALSSGGASAKESPCRMQSNHCPPGDIDGASVPDERSSNSNQPLSSGALWSSGPNKGSANNLGSTKAGNSRSHASSKGVNSGSKDVGLGKHIARSGSAGIDKKLVIQAVNESAKVETSGSNHRFILRLPNTTKNTLSSSYADAVAVPSTKESSSNAAERGLDMKDRKSRLHNTSMENANTRNTSSRHDEVEKHEDISKRSEIECHSSESYVSFSSTECCTLEYKKSHKHQEGHPVNDMGHDASKCAGEKSIGCGPDFDAGISLLASIAADEDLRIEVDQKNTKDTEIPQQGTRSTCLTDSENSPMSGITENSGRIEVVPDIDVKDAQGNCGYLKPVTDEGAQHMEMSAGAIDQGLGESDENVKESEGVSSDPKLCEGKSEGINDGKLSHLQNRRPRSPSVRSSDDTKGNENEVTVDSGKICCPLKDIKMEDKEDKKPGGEMDGKDSAEMIRESAYKISGEDAIEVAMQVAKEATMQVKEVKEEMENYVKASTPEKGYNKIVPSTDHPVAEKYTLESTNHRNKEKNVSADLKASIAVKEETLDQHEDKETDQIIDCTEKSTLGIDKDPEAPGATDEYSKSVRAGQNQVQMSSPSAPKEHQEVVKADEISTPVEASSKHGFDLNEGLHLEDSPQETTTAVSYPVASIPITPVALNRAVSSTLSSIIPPRSPLQGKSELGWRGSAATSAFRPAEPRKTPERPHNAIENNSAYMHCASVSKPVRPLIDLNIPDGDLEEGSNFLPAHNLSVSKCDLDLNRIVEGEENGAVLASGVNNDRNISSKRRKAVKHDFDLNDELVMDVMAPADPVDPHRKSWISGYGSLPSAGYKMGSSEMVNLHQWNQLGSTFPSGPVPAALAQVRQDAPFSVSMPPTFFNLGQTQGISPFHPDMLRPSVELSSSASALTYPTPTSLQYTNFPLGFPSTSFSAAPSFLDSSGSTSYPSMASSFLTSGAIHPSLSKPPYLTGFVDATVSGNGAWARPNLDLNAGPSLDLNSGPEHVDADVREDRNSTRQAPPVFGTPFSLEQKFRVFHPSADPSDSQKRKEAEGAWDLYRTGAGSEFAGVDSRDERVTLRQASVFGNHFSLEDQMRAFCPPEGADSSKRKEPEGGWDAYRGGMKLWR